MNILVMRHGEAESYAAGGDAGRRLTARGEQQALAAGRYLKQQGFAPDQLWVSPYLRAQQTAAAVQRSLTVPRRVDTEQLIPEADVEALVEALLQQVDQTLMLVSHQPLVSYLMGRLCGQDPYAVPALATASMALLRATDVVPGCFEIVWDRHSPDYSA